MSEATNEDHPSAHVIAGQLRQAIGRGESAEVIAAFHAELEARRFERALARALSSAPPLTPTQIADVRSILNQYLPTDDADGE